MATPTFPKLFFHELKTSFTNRVGAHVKNTGPHIYSNILGEQGLIFF